MTQPKPLVYMRFRPAWTYIDGIREFGRFFCERTFEKGEVAERATMVLQEMLENAVKYSTEGPDELEVALDREGSFLQIEITSTPEPEHKAALEREIALLYERPAEEAYQAAFERAAADASGGSRLGLARIRFEGRLDLSVTHLDRGRLTVTARGNL